ncbi:MAG: DEAD/DEAH box helicase [Planctomycetota bacterium]|jgi:DEAD/DEAH box helicase domain-containing protein
MTEHSDRRPLGVPPDSPVREPEGSSSLRPGPGRGGRRRARRALGVEGVLSALRSDPELRDRFVHWHDQPPRPARTRALPERLHPALVEVLGAQGLDELYEHQVRAVELALDGKDVLVATPTASGKTLAYSLPVLQRLLETDGRSRSLWMFPTKALSQDQSAALNRRIEALCEARGGETWHSFTYDGDTPPSVRRTLRERGHVVLTNPWMLHQGILPNHGKWAELFRDLEYIVIDEVHTLSGVFGSSVANVLRRLVRIAEFYGSSPRFLLSSATIPEPAAHGRALIGREVAVVHEDGSPSGRRVFGVYDPPVVNPVAGLRASALEEARRLAQVACGPDHQTIFFCNRRTAVEVLTRYLKEGASRLGLRPDEIRGYRGGYLPDLRREIEGGLRDGSVKVVVTTNALELGVDIGALDVAVLVGYPGSQASFWQRAGRVGRRGNQSLCVMIARSDPVDQYLAHNPGHLFAAPQERLGLDPDNLVLLSEQLKCAAFELPFKAERDTDGAERVDDFGASPHVPEILDYLAEEAGFLNRRDDTWYWMTDAYPAQDVSLAGGELDNVLVLDAETNKALGETDREGALTTVHEGAIYQVEGETWKIERFDYTNRRAYARRVASDYYTDAQTDSEVLVLRLERRNSRVRPASEVEDVSIWRGEVHVTTVATLYKKIRFYTRENVGAEDINLPPEELDTEAFMVTVSEETAADLGLHAGSRGAAWGAVGGLLRRVAPLWLRCQPQDLGLSAQVKGPHFERPTLFLYDRVQGGVGLSALLFERFFDLLGSAREVVRACECLQGCPACVGPVEEVGPVGKETTLAVLEHLLSGASLVPCELDDDVVDEAASEARSEA